MRDIEKNDVDIEQLFRWKKEITIEDGVSNQSVILYLKLVGDADVGKARTYALRKSSDFRRALKTQGSDERVSLLSEFDEFQEQSKEHLVSMILLLKLEDLQGQAIRNVDMEQPTPPKSDAELEDQEEYQKLIDEFPKKFSEAVSEKTRKLEAVEKERLDNLEPEVLYKEYERLIINRLCIEEMSNKFYEMIIYYATFKDKNYRKLAFKSFADFQNISYNLKEKLVQEYKNLEMGMGVLKKLPEVTE